MAYSPIPIVNPFDANQAVLDQMDRLNGIADGLIDSAQDALGNLQSSYINTAILDPRFFWSDADLDAILNQLGEVPDPDLAGDWLDNVNLPDTGGEFTFNPAVLALLQQQLPEYLMPAAPVLPPLPEEPADPGEPSPILAPSRPTLPEYETPETTVNEPAPTYADFTSSVPIPAMRPIILPTPPTLQLDSIVFDAVPPTFDFDTPTSEITNFTAGTYSPLMLDELKTAILNVLQGGTGLPPELEDALFERAREREAELGAREMDTVRNEFAARGYKYPPGALARRLDRTRSDAATKISQLNRDQFVTRLQLEVEQFRAVLSSAVGLEEMWSNAFIAAERLRMDAVRMQVDFALQLFNAQISKVGAQTAIFTAQAQVFRERIAAEEAKIRAYQSELEAKRIIGELNQQDIAIYAERIKALNVNADIYRSRVEGYVAKFKEVEARVAVFRELLASNRDKVGVYEADVRAMGELIKAQATRDERFQIRASIFSTKTDAVKSRYEAMLSAYNQNFKIAELRRDTFVANGERIKTMIEAESGRIDAIVSRYQAVAAQLSAKSEVEKARYSLLLSFAQAQIERMKAAADILLKNGEINIQSALQAQNLMIRARETAATTLAQLAAGMTAAANVNASISSSYGQSVSYSYSGELEIA